LFPVIKKNKRKMKKSQSELYDKLATQEKRMVNRLVKSLATGELQKTELSSICRSISRNTAGSKTEKQPPNSYIIYYKEQFPSVRKDLPDATLGEIAKFISTKWKALGDGQKVYHKQASELRNTHVPKVK
jgi:hypothetical protein